MLSALCTPYHVPGWLPYTDSKCKIFYVQIMSYHQPILNVKYHKYVFSYVLSSPYTWMSRWSTSTTSSSSPPSLSALPSLASTMLGVSAGTHRQWPRKRQFSKEKKQQRKNSRSLQKNLTPRYCRRESLCSSRFLYSALWNLTSPATHSGTIFLSFLTPQVH